MNLLQNFSKWRWWLLGGLAATGIGGWYALEFQAQQRPQATVPSPSIPVPLQRPEFTEKPTQIKPTTPIKKTAPQALGGAAKPFPAKPDATLSAKDRLLPSGVTDQSDGALGTTQTLPGQATLPYDSTPTGSVAGGSGGGTTSLPPRVVTRANPAPPVAPKPRVVKSNPAPQPKPQPAQQAKVIKSEPAVEAPASSGGAAQSAPKSTYIPEERARFGAAQAPQTAQSYEPAPNTLPPIESSQIPADAGTVSLPPQAPSANPPAGGNPDTAQ
jgi:hypothetical protein